MVDIVVFDDKLAANSLEQESQGIGGRSVQTQTAVASQFSKNNVFVADPPLVESHRHHHGLHGEVGQERNTGNVPEFLLVVGVQGQERVGVLGEMVGAVELPERLGLVHDAVVDVEPKVENDTVETSFEEYPSPSQVDRSFGDVVAKDNGEDGTEDGGGQQRVHNLGDANIGNSISLVLVAVEEADLMS